MKIDYDAMVTIRDSQHEWRVGPCVRNGTYKMADGIDPHVCVLSVEPLAECVPCKKGLLAQLSDLGWYVCQGSLLSEIAEWQRKSIRKCNNGQPHLLQDS